MLACEAMRSSVLPFVAFSLVVFSQGISGHSRPFTTLTIKAGDAPMAATLDIRVADLVAARLLDSSRSGVVPESQLSSRNERIFEYVRSRLDVSTGGERCEIGRGHGGLSFDPEHDLVSLPLSIDCRGKGKDRLDIQYRLFFDAGPDHTGMAIVEHGGHSDLSLFSRDQTTYAWRASLPDSSRAIMAFLREGIFHILTGLDHLLFLLVLLLASPLASKREAARWKEALRAMLWEMFKVVTAFTVAHSLTLTLACLTAVRFDERVVETGIALSVVLAAARNLARRELTPRWTIAFGFGLLHGLGFASALRDSLGGSSMVPALLVAFNLGVELGQLAVVAIALPLLYLAGRQYWYGRIILRGGSWLSAAVALLWAVDRATGWDFMPL